MLDLLIRYYHEGIPTDYFIDPFGRCVYSMKSGKELKPTIDRNGYVVYSLYINGRCHKIGHHQLVARCMLKQSDPSLNEVDHLDGNKQHNSYDNLEWVNRKENVRRSVKLGLKPPSRGERNGMSRYSDDTITNAVNMLILGKSVSTVSTELNLPESLVYGIISGKCYSYLTKDITFPESVYKRGKRPHKKLASDVVDRIKLLRSEGLTAKEISLKLGLTERQVFQSYYYKS